MIRFRFGGAAREIFITLSSKSVVRMTDSKKYVPYLSTYFLLKLCFISMRYTSHSSMEPDLTPLWILSCSCVPAMHADQPDCAQQDWTTWKHPKQTPPMTLKSGVCLLWFSFAIQV
jgi:hypothetical protein